MMYEKKPIGRLVTLRQGFAINKNTKHHMSDEPTKLHLLRIGDMKNNDFQVYVKDTIPKRFIAKDDDIIYTRTGQVGLVFRNQYGVVHNNCFTVTSNDKNELFQSYLFYALQEKSFYEEALSRATGAAQPDLPHEAFKSIEIYLPPIKIQERIVQILDVYDRLIKNNQEQIKLLEEAAQRLYKEWFVDLRFPGYEDIKIVDGVPEGWHLGTLEEVLVYHDKLRKPLSSMQRQNFKGQYRYYGAAGVLDYVQNYLFNGTYLLFGEDGSVVNENGNPILQYVTGKFWVNNHAHVFTGKEPYSTEYIYMMLKKMNVIDVVSGVAQPKISKARLNAKKILVPDKNTVMIYNEKVKSIFEQILLLEKVVDLLNNARNRLLPKLMNGEIEV